jgi:hypothetical protein
MKSRGRSVPGIVATLVVAGALLAPAVSEAAAFLTKKKADRRYLGNTTVVKSTATVGQFGSVILTAMCPPGKQAVGGGAESPAFRTSSSGGMDMTENAPVQSGSRSVGWTIEAATVGSMPVDITVVAICSP